MLLGFQVLHKLEMVGIAPLYVVARPSAPTAVMHQDYECLGTIKKSWVLGFIRHVFILSGLDETVNMQIIGHGKNFKFAGICSKCIACFPV